MKYNILIHAINGIGVGHINRTLILAKEIQLLKEVNKIIFVTNSSNIEFITKDGFIVEKLKYGIEDTLSKISGNQFESEANEFMEKIVKKYSIQIILHDTYFIKRTIEQFTGIQHFLILRNSDLVYLNTIKDYLIKFKKVYIPHIKNELGKNKQDFLSNFFNVRYINYIIEKEKIINSEKKNKIVISPGYGGDYENTLFFFKYVNMFLLQIPSIEEYDVFIFLGKHHNEILKHINFGKNFQVKTFSNTFKNHLEDAEIFIGRGGYNSVNEAFFYKCKSLFFEVSRVQESQGDRVDFFQKKLNVNFFKKGTYDLQIDIQLFESLLKEKVSLKTQFFDSDGVKNFMNDFRKELKKKNILVYKNIFLPQSEHFIFQELFSFKNINPIIFSLKLENNIFLQNNFQIFSYKKYEQLLHKDYPKILNKNLYLVFLQHIFYLVKKYDIKLIYTEFLFDFYFIQRVKLLFPDVKIISAARGYDIYSFFPRISKKYNNFFTNLDRLLVRDTNMLSYIRKIDKNNTKVEVVRSVLDIVDYKFKIKNYNKLDILIGGRFTEKKGIIPLLYVLKEVENEKHIGKIGLVGDGELKKDILDKINYLGLENKIIYYGFLTHDSFLIKLKEYNCFINYSQVSKNGDNEGVNNMIVENMLSGNIVFSTIVGGIGDALENNNTGIQLSGNKYKDIQIIKKSIKKYDFPLIVKNAYEKSKLKFGKKNSIDKLEEIIDILLKNNEKL